MTTVHVCVSTCTNAVDCHVPLPSISFRCSKPPFSTDPFIHNSCPVTTHTPMWSDPFFLCSYCSYCSPFLFCYPPFPTSKTAWLCYVVDISAVTLNLPSTPDLDARLTGEPCFSPGCAACAALTLAAGPAAPVIIHTHTRKQALMAWSGVGE